MPTAAYGELRLHSIHDAERYCSLRATKPVSAKIAFTGR